MFAHWFVHSPVMKEGEKVVATVNDPVDMVQSLFLNRTGRERHFPLAFSIIRESLLHYETIARHSERTRL
jgi:hypothetical protein